MYSLLLVCCVLHAILIPAVHSVLCTLQLLNDQTRTCMLVYMSICTGYMSDMEQRHTVCLNTQLLGCHSSSQSFTALSLHINDKDIIYFIAIARSSCYVWQRRPPRWVTPASSIHKSKHHTTQNKGPTLLTRKSPPPDNLSGLHIHSSPDPPQHETMQAWPPGSVKAPRGTMQAWPPGSVRAPRGTSGMVIQTHGC